MAEAADRDPKQCRFMFQYGILLQDRAMYARSTEIYRKRLENCNDTLDPKIHVFIGNNFFADSLLDSAIVSYEKALALKPGYPYAKTRLGETYIAKGEVDRGEDLLDEIIEAAKTSTSPDERKLAVGAIARLNDRALQEKQWSTIVSRSKVATELDPKSVTAWLYLAIGYQGLQDAENAKRAYREVLKLNPNNEAAKKNLKALGG
jgi:Tfp pilus assembly protein PilF